MSDDRDRCLCGRPLSETEARMLPVIRERDDLARQLAAIEARVISAEATLDEARLLGEQWKRSSDSDMRRMGADLVQILNMDQ